MAAIQIKCYFIPDELKVSKKSVDKVNEIRRFNVETGPAGSYDNLLEKIMSYFKGSFASKDEIKTYYLDEEEEFIGFSSDGEFQYGIDVHLALKMSNTHYNSTLNVFKVYISKRKDLAESSSKSDEDEKSQNFIHSGVTCDGCQGPVVGIRYKCTQCPDYDLCSTCEGKGIHKDTTHKFIKMEFPNFFGRRCGRFNRSNRCHQQQQQQPQSGFAGFSEMFKNFAIPQNDHEGLKKFGERLKGFLEPFGVDVDYYVDDHTKKSEEKKESEKPNEPKNPETQQKMDSQTSVPMPGVETASNKPNSVFPNLINIETNLPTTSTTTTSSTTTSTTSSTNSLPRTPSLINVPVIPSAPLISTPSNSLPRLQDEVDGFNMIDMEKEVKIMKAVQQLKEMGFNDENNWLTMLVTSKDGNINAVLDALSPFGFRH